MDIKASEDIIVQLKELWLPQSWYAERTREKNLFYYLRAFSGTQDYFQSGTSLFLPLIAQLVEQYQYHGILFNCELKEFTYFSPEKEETISWEAGLSKFNTSETVFVNEDIFE